MTNPIARSLRQMFANVNGQAPSEGSSHSRLQRSEEAAQRSSLAIQAIATGRIATEDLVSRAGSEGAAFRRSLEETVALAVQAGANGSDMRFTQGLLAKVGDAPSIEAIHQASNSMTQQEGCRMTPLDREMMLLADRAGGIWKQMQFQKYERSANRDHTKPVQPISDARIDEVAALHKQDPEHYPATPFGARGQLMGIDRLQRLAARASESELHILGNAREELTTNPAFTAEVGRLCDQISSTVDDSPEGLAQAYANAQGLKSEVHASLEPIEVSAEDLRQWHQDVSRALMELREEVDDNIMQLMQGQSFMDQREVTRTVDEISDPRIRHMSHVSKEIKTRLGDAREAAGLPRIEELINSIEDRAKQQGIKLKAVARDQTANINFHLPHAQGAPQEPSAPTHSTSGPGW